MDANFSDETWEKITATPDNDRFVYVAYPHTRNNWHHFAGRITEA